MKTLIVIIATLIASTSFAQTSDTITEKEKKAAMKFIRKHLPPSYKDVRMILRETMFNLSDSLAINGITKVMRYYTFNNLKIKKSELATELVFDGPGYKEIEKYIYFSICKTDNRIGVLSISGE